MSNVRALSLALRSMYRRTATLSSKPGFAPTRTPDQPTVSALRGQGIQKLEHSLVPHDSSDIQRNHRRVAIDTPFCANPFPHRRSVQERRARDSSRQDQMAFGIQAARRRANQVLRLFAQLLALVEDDIQTLQCLSKASALRGGRPHADVASCRPASRGDSELTAKSPGQAACTAQVEGENRVERILFMQASRGPFAEDKGAAIRPVGCSEFGDLNARGPVYVDPAPYLERWEFGVALPARR